MIALEAIVDFAKTEEINTSRMVMHIVDENKKIDTFRLTQVFVVFNLILYSYWSIELNTYLIVYVILSKNVYFVSCEIKN